MTWLNDFKSDFIDREKDVAAIDINMGCPKEFSIRASIVKNFV